MKTAVIGEDADGLVVYNRSLIDLARHFGFHPKVCRPYRAKTKGKSSARFATSARISTWRAASGISMTSMLSCVAGSTRWPIRALTPPPSAWSTKRLLKSGRRCARYRWHPTAPC
jgi:hypothetical protein